MKHVLRDIQLLNWTNIFAGYITLILGYINDWEKKKEIPTMTKFSKSKPFSPLSASSNKNAWICIGTCEWDWKFKEMNKAISK